MKAGTVLIALFILPLNVQEKKKNYPVTLSGLHFIRPHITRLFSIICLCGVLCIGCASVSKEQGVKTFQQQYKEYQGYARAGHSALKAKEYVKAIDHFTKASEVSPFEPSLYHYRGLAWYKSGNKDKAIEDFDKVIILDPRWSSTYMYRGLCRMKRGEYKEAQRDYMKALNLKPDDARIHNNLAWLYATAEDEKFRDKAKAL